MKNLTKKTIMTLLLCFAFSCGAFILFSNSNTIAFAQEQTDSRDYVDCVVRPENYVGYGCNNEIDLQINLSGQIENRLPESIDGFGCGSSCGASREGGYSSGVSKCVSIKNQIRSGIFDLACG